MSQRPIAAPSANLFSHVSPTSAIHVFNDFYDKDVSIIDGENCEFGIESTVVKLTSDGKNSKITILRAGSLSEKSLRDALEKSQQFRDVQVTKIVKETHVSEQINSEAPGMLLKHYSPYVETYLVEVEEVAQQDNLEVVDVKPKETILIDFGKCLEKISPDYLKYFSLSEKGDMREAMNSLYSTLRMAENIVGAQQILIVNLNTYYKHEDIQVKDLPEYLETVYDKSFRSASGKKLKLSLKTNTYFREI